MSEWVTMHCVDRTSLVHMASQCRRPADTRAVRDQWIELPELFGVEDARGDHPDEQVREFCEDEAHGDIVWALSALLPAGSTVKAYLVVADGEGTFRVKTTSSLVSLNRFSNREFSVLDRKQVEGILRGRPSPTTDSIIWHKWTMANLAGGVSTREAACYPVTCSAGDTAPEAHWGSLHHGYPDYKLEHDEVRIVAARHGDAIATELPLGAKWTDKVASLRFHANVVLGYQLIGRAPLGWYVRLGGQVLAPSQEAGVLVSQIERYNTSAGSLPVLFIIEPPHKATDDGPARPDSGSEPPEGDRDDGRGGSGQGEHECPPDSANTSSANAPSCTTSIPDGSAPSGSAPSSSSTAPPPPPPMSGTPQSSRHTGCGGPHCGGRPA